MAQKALRAVIFGGLLIGLATRADWLGFAIVFAGTAVSLAANRNTQSGWRWIAFHLALTSLTWGVLMAGFFALMDAESYQPLGALFAAGLFGGLMLLVTAVAHLAGFQKYLYPKP